MKSDEYKGYFRYWGKVSKVEDNDKERSIHLLPYHCLDVAAVGHVLLRLDENLLKRLRGNLPLPEEDVRRLIVFFLALHDVGKFSVSFQGLVEEALGILNRKLRIRPYSHPHTELGLALWEDTLLGHCLSAGVFHQEYADQFMLERYLPPLVQPFFGHHGQPVTCGDVEVYEHFPDEDIEAARSFLADCAGLLVPEPISLPSDLGSLYDELKVRSWLFSGFAVVCDWIGSNSDFFSYCGHEMPIAEYWPIACRSAELAVEQAGILPVQTRQFSGMGDLFPDLKDFSSSPLQAYVSECSLPAGPQLWIIEDITGSGKTEAAVVLCHRLMQLGYDGFFVALPTMATADAMYERMAKAYRRLFTAEQNPSLALAHGHRELMEAFTTSILRMGGGSSAEYSLEKTKEDTESSAACAQWIADNRKKTFLAHAGVGTIDQALLAGLPSRHHTLRLFGLARKVLIVDEVHACDAYMTELLKALLEFHSSLGGSAILLSATIPQKMRRDLTTAFLKGLDADMQTDFQDSFPAVTSAGIEGITEMPLKPRPDLRRSLAVELVHDKDGVLDEIKSAAASGACVCRLCNTVADAIEAYEALCEDPAVDRDRLLLFHARFAMGHRLDREHEVLSRFGKAAKREDRRNAILVATQVVEQSLDLDFDFMVSDLAPIDLIIQRAGRIHRHSREFRGDRPQPVLWVLSPHMTQTPDKDWLSGFLRGTSFVYPDHGNMWRTAALLDTYRGWTMPDDARMLIEGVYGECAAAVPDGLVDKQNRAHGERIAEKSQGMFNALSVTRGYGGDQTALFSDTSAPTRLGEPSVTFRLAVRSGYAITPIYAHHRHPWELSEVQVRESSIALSAATENDRERAAATMKDRGKWSELIILEPSGEGCWKGVACEKNGNRVDVSYSLLTGLTVHKAAGATRAGI
ncbi:MAG: CRISPR-associated helicase Cas3' [Pseudomonadota bacterium]